MFKINSNVDYSVTNEFIETDLKTDTIEFLIENIKTYENSDSGEIDQIFFSYLILKLSENEFVKNIHFLFDERIDSSRIYSLQHQLEHLKKITKKNVELFIVEITENIDQETGEILEYKKKSSNFLSKNELHQSSAFSYPLLISKDIKSTDLFFSSNSKIYESKIYELYYKNVVTEVKLKADRTKAEKEKFLNELNLNMLNFVELSILNICLNSRLNLFLDNRIKANREKNKKTILNLIFFAKKVSKGLQELALNIENHSEQKKGVITIRSFDKPRIKKLKSEDEKKYLEKSEDEWFLDINVVDLGNVNIRKKYSDNIRGNIKDFKSEIDKHKKLSLEHKAEKKEQIEKELQEDISIVENKSFGYKDFFLLDKSRRSLNHQKNKFQTRIGLQFFTQLVTNQYQGFVKTSSGEEKAVLYYKTNTEIESSIENSNEFIKFGTSFNCLIPIRNWEYSLTLSNDKKVNDNSAEKNSFDYLKEFSFKEYKFDLKEIDEKTIVKYIPDISDLDKDKYNANLKISLDFINNKDFQKSILLINYDDLDNSKLINESYWLRFLWALNDSSNTVIIYNNPVDDFREIAFIRHLWNITPNTNVDFWEKGKRILFYSKKFKKNADHSNSEYFRYGANLLAGSTTADFNIINHNIWNHHYSHKEHIFELKKTDKLSEEGKNQLKSILFKGRNLHYFEVLLKTKTKEEKNISLFEKSIQYSLNTLFLEKETSNTNNKGYKIEKTHFKLGSKIHISDFYYAKKLFQNSFFTTPLAYIISEQIKRDIPNLTNASIIGYENYSGFLVSTIKNFLTINNDKSSSINHYVIDKNGILSRELKKLKENIIIITPIASTFNTSLRIEDQIKGIERRNKTKIVTSLKIQQPFYNVVLVAHREDGKELYEDVTDNMGNVLEDKSNIYNKYKWQKIDKKKKVVKTKKYDGNNREQKYLIPVYTKWQEASNCSACFPEDYTDEQCLIETGQASITPQLIFGFPKNKPINNEIAFAKGLCLKESLLYGNLFKSDNRYLYFNRTGKIISDKVNKENYKNICDWLTQKVKPIFDNNYQNSKIVIVTPSSGSHSKFIDLINEKVFDFRANCIIISLKEDYIENTESLYADGLHKADLVIFVDDVLSTINSFLETNYIVKYIREKNKTGKGIDFCISLINRMSYSNEENLLLKLAPLVNNKTSQLIKKVKIKLNPSEEQSQEDIDKNEEEIKVLINEIEKDEVSLDALPSKLLYFTKINNASIEEANKKFPLEIERKRYKNLSKNSSLDAVRNYFNNKKNALAPIDLSKKPIENIKDYSENKKGRKNKKLYQLLVLNALYEIFDVKKGETDKNRIERINNFFPKLNNITHSSSTYLKSLEKIKAKIEKKLNYDAFHKDIIEVNNKNLEYVIIKVICSTPLIYYKEIREISFKWVNCLIIEILKKINDDNFSLKEFFEIKPNSFYSDYRTLKFLLKRSVKLKSNLIISTYFFESMNKLFYSLNKKDKIVEINKVKQDSQNKFTKVAKHLLTKYNNSEKERQTILKHQKSLQDEGIIDNQDFSVTVDEDGKLISEYQTDKKEISQVTVSKQMNAFEIDNDLKELKLIPLYKTSTSKKIIYHLVALIQELIYDNETKSFKLDEQLSKQIEQYGDDHNENIENGNFLHYLRLLRVENTEVLNSLSKYTINKFDEYYPNLQDNKTLKLYESIIGRDKELNFTSDEKYKSVIDNFQGENYKRNINRFLVLKSIFNNYFKDSKYLENESIQNKTKEILTFCKKILGSELVDNVCLSVNYKNEIDADFKNYYHFYQNEKNNIEIAEDSLTSFFAKNIPAENNIKGNYTLSNLEIIKNSTGEAVFRENIFEDRNKVVSNVQFKDLNNDTSLLFVRISDFNKKEDNNELYTQGILTFYLKKGKRLDEKLLRLVLALRKDFSKYLRTKTSGTTFLELLQSKEKEETKRLLKHSIRTYLTNQSKIYEELSNITADDEKSKLLNLLFILNNAIGGQTDNFEILSEKISYKKDLLNEYLKNLLETDYLGNGIYNSSVQIRTDSINLHKTIFDVIIPELIYNLKKYTPVKQKEKGVEIIVKKDSIIIKNNMNKNRPENTRTGEGLKMCNKILAYYQEDRYKLVDNIIKNKEFNQFEIELKI